VTCGPMGLIATLDFSEYEYEYRDAEYEYEKKHDVLTPCQIVCDPLSRGVGSGASQKQTIEDFGATLGPGCSSCSCSCSCSKGDKRLVDHYQTSTRASHRISSYSMAV